ncbi:MAG: hypothetical protein RR575_00175 [Acinetobacter sp.]
MAGYKDDQVQNAFARIAQELSKKQQPKVTPYEQTIGARSQINTQDYAPRVNPTELLQQYSDYGDQFDNRNIASKALNTGRRAAGAFGELFEQAGGAIVNGAGAANTIGLDKNAETAFYKLQDQKNNTKYQEELALLDDPTKALASGRYLDQRDINERKAYLTNRLQQNQLTPEEGALLYNPDGSETHAKQRLNWSKSAEDYGKLVTGDREKGIAGSLNARNWYDHTGEKAYQANKKYNGTSPRETAIAQRDARDAYDQGDYFGWATKHLGTFAKATKESANALLDNPAYLVEEAAGMAPYLMEKRVRLAAVAIDAARVQNDSYDAFVERELRAPTTGESLGILGMTAAYTGANYAGSAITAGALKGKSIASSLGLKSSSVPSAIEKTAIDKIRNAALIQSTGQLGRSSLAEGATEAVQQQIEGNWGSLNNTIDSAAMGEAFTMGAAITGTIGTPAATANAVLGTGLQAKAALVDRNLNKSKEDSPEIDQSITTEEFASPTSPNFNPKAATVRMTQEAAQAETPEAKQEIKAKQEEVLQASASRLDILENIIESLDDVEGTRTGVEEFRAQVQSAKAADPSNPQVAQLEEALANADTVMAEIDANANDPEYTARVKKEYSGLINQLNKATEIRNNSEALADDLANNPTTIPSKILGAPSSYTAAELAKASKDVKYAEADREVLRKLSEARQAYDDTQDIKRVSRDIIDGSDYSKTIMSYVDDMSRAVASGNTQMQEVTSKMLDRFAKSHQSKADTVMEAWEAAKAAPGTAVEVARVAGNPKWFINTGKPVKNSRENASLQIMYNPGKYGHSESLVSAIAMESNLINKVKTSVDALAARSTNDTSDPMERMQGMIDSLDTTNGADLEAQQLADEGRQQQAQANQAKGKSIPQNTPVTPDDNMWEGFDESSLQLEPVNLDSIKPDLSNTEIQFDESGVGSAVPTPSQATGTPTKPEGEEAPSGEGKPQQKKKTPAPGVNTPKKEEEEVSVDTNREVNSKGDVRFTGAANADVRELEPTTIIFRKQEGGKYISKSRSLEFDGVSVTDPDAQMKTWLDEGKLIQLDAEGKPLSNEYFNRDPKTSVLTVNSSNVKASFTKGGTTTYLMKDGLVFFQSDTSHITVMQDQVFTGIPFKDQVEARFNTKGIANKDTKSEPLARLSDKQFKQLEKLDRASVQELAAVLHPDTPFAELLAERTKALIKEYSIKVVDKPKSEKTLILDFNSEGGFKKVDGNFESNPYKAWLEGEKSDTSSLLTAVQNFALSPMMYDPRVEYLYVPATFEQSTPEVDMFLAAVRVNLKTTPVVTTPKKKAEDAGDNLPTLEVRKFGDIEYIVDRTIPTMARTDKFDNITLNPRTAENTKEFWDYFGGVVHDAAPARTKQASQQKKEVLAQLGVKGYSLDYLKQQLNTPRKLNEFLLRHEQSHVDHNDRAVYYSNGESLLTQDKVDIETRATIEALVAMGIEPQFEGNIDNTFVSTSETPYEIYDIPLNENELKDMFGGLDTTTDYVPDFGTTVAANKEAQALREANKDLPLAEHDLVREAVNIVPTKLRDMPVSVTARLRRKDAKSGYNTAYEEILEKHLLEAVHNPTAQQINAMKELGGMFYKFATTHTGIFSNTKFLKEAGLEKFNNFASYLVDSDAQVITAKDEVVDKLLPQVEDAITIAAFSWIMENGSTLMRMDNLPKALGIEGNDLTVPYHIYDMLKAVGSAKPSAAETIGNKVIDMLGFKFTSDVADTRKSKLAVALGQLAVHRMTMAGYVEENTLEPEVVRAITREIMVENYLDIDEAELQAKNQYTFINVTHSKKTFEPTELSAKVLNATKGSESVLTKAFGVAPRVKPIRTSKPKADTLVTQKTSDRLGTQIPSAQVEALSKAHTYKWGINKSLNQLHTNLGETDELKALRDRMYGKLSPEEIDAKQAMKRDGIKANNQSIEREIQIYEASVDTLAKSRFGLDNDFYLEQEVQNQQRSHMANDLNPVASKLHRGLVELKDHRVKFPMTSVERNAIKAFFKTGSTEALLDSQTNTITPLGEFIQTVALLTEDLMPEGVSTTADKTQILNYAPQYLEWALRGEGTDVLIILEKMINGDNVPVEQVKKVVDAVNKAGMKAQSLKALVNLIAFKNAFTSGKDTEFEVNISLEVDGVNNGPFLTQVLMNTLAASMYGAGGMYTESDGITNVPQYKDLGNPDMYEYNITHLHNAIAAAPAKAGRVAYAKNSDVPAERITQEVLQAVQVLHPKMLERKGTKTITTVINFSSGNKATAAGIIGDIKDSILSGLEKYSSYSVDNASRKLFIGKLNYLLLRGGLKVNDHVKYDADLLNLVLTPQQDKAINKSLEEPLMHVVSEFIKEAYPEYIKARDDITAAGQLAVGLFKPVYDAEVAKRTEALPEDVKKVEGLSKEAHEQILTDLRKDMPTFKSYLAGKGTNTEESSLPLVKIASKRSDQARDKSEFYIFGARDVNKLGLDKDGSFKISKPSMYTYHVTQQAKTYEIVPAGVANNPKGVHSTDAGIAHTQLGNWVTMNIHDALTAIVGKGREFSKELNKVTTDALIEVDFNSNMVTGSLKPLTAFLGLDSKAQLASKAELQKAAQSINKSHDNDVHDAKGNLVPNSSIGDAVSLLLDAAFDRDIAKLNTLLLFAYVNQYGLEGGEYKLVDADIKRIEEKLEEVRAKRVEAVKQLVPQAVQLDSTFGVVGSKGIYQDAPVTEVTKVVEEKIETGVDKRTTQFYLSNVPKDTPIDIKVLNSAIAHDTNKAKDVNPNLATVLSGQMYNLVKKALPEQLEVRVLHATDPRALEHWSKGRYGWFKSNVDGKPVIYLTADANGNFDPAIAIHELMHAVTFVALEKNDTPAAKEITALREQFVKFLANQGITPRDGVAYAIKNNHEFVSTVFERPEVAMLLNQMKVKATRKRGLEDFVKAISKLVSQAFGLKPVKLEAGEITGLEALIGSVLTLSEGAENTTAYNSANVPSSILGASIRKAQQSVKAMNLTDLMEQLKGTDTNFDAQLKETMDEFALPIFDRMDTGLFDSIGLSNDPESVWQDAIATNTTVTTDKAVLSGYVLQPLERFAVEAVYAATKAVAKERGLSISYAELDKAFSQARNKIKPKDLYKGDWSKATTAEKATAQAKWDHLFKITQENDHLARFSSMVSGSAEVNALLANVKTDSGNKVSKDADVNEKVQTYVMKAVEFLAQLISGVKSGAPVSEYVKSALKSVAKVDLKYRGGIVNEINERISKVEGKIDDAVMKARRKVASKIPAMNSTTVPEVTLVRDVATSAIEGTLMDNLKNTRETILNHSSGKLGFWGELVNEIAENTPFKDIVEKMKRHVNKTSQTKELEKEYTIKNVLSTFKDGGKKLKRKTREALTHLMVADVSALLGAYTPKQLHRMYHNPEYLNSVISQQASAVMALDARGTQLISRSKDLARYMVTNLGPENNDLALNAMLIAMGAGTSNKIALKDVDPDLVAAIDSLVSLYAIRYTPSDVKAEISSVMDTELPRGDVNGIEAILKFHKGLADEARDELFIDNPLSMTKGYIPEITNPNHEIRFAKTDEEAKNFKDQFFREVKVLDPNPLARGDKVRMFLSEDAGLTRMISGTLELFGKNPRGTDADVDVSVVLKASQAKQRSLHANTSYDPYKENGTSALIPKYDLDGNVIGYRYEMSSYERDSLLGRDNDFANILGQYAATNFNKMNVPYNNRMVVDALVKEKQENYDAHPDRFVTVGFNVRDKELAKLWDLLPQDTRDYVREVTGKSVLHVPKEVLLPVFGYQKYSATQGFDKPRSERNLYEKVYVAVFKAVFGNNARVYGARTERGMQSAVALTKNFIVIRNLRTLAMNIISNTFLLQAHGIGLADILKDTVYALRAGMQHRKDNALLTAKRQMLYTGLGNQKQLEQEVLRLEQAIANNPLAEFINEGMMPSIVDDVALTQDDAFSFKSALERKFEKQLSKIPAGVRTTAEWLMVSPSTPLYQFLNNTTQLSDFTSKYVMYNYYRNNVVKKDRLEHDAAIQIASDNFINYDMPTSKGMQYLNDMGIIMFTKYNLRIQKALFRLLERKPARALLQALVMHHGTDIPYGIDPIVWNQLGIPFREGAFAFPSVIDEPITMNMATSIL